MPATYEAADGRGPKSANAYVAAQTEALHFTDYYSCCRRGDSYSPAPSSAQSRIEGIGRPRPVQRMHEAGNAGSIVTVICDGGACYAHSCYEPGCYSLQGIDIARADRQIEMAVRGGAMASVEALW